MTDETDGAEAVIHLDGIRLPCTHVVPKPSPFGGVITCPVDERVWKVEPDAGGRAWSAQEVVKRGN